MRCCICKEPIKPRETRYYNSYRTRSGRVHRKTWCGDCDVKRSADVDAMLEVAGLPGGAGGAP